MTMGFSIMNCCADSGDCGTSMNNAACIATPDADPQCPVLDTMGIQIPSCCTSDGKCGLNGAAFMKGCTSLEENIAMYGQFLMFPSPKPCTPAGQ
jgi:hypothetical protein